MSSAAPQRYPRSWRNWRLPFDPDALPAHAKPQLIIGVLVGGFLGTLSRYGLVGWLSRFEGWPYGTLAVNLLGAFVLGLLLEGLSRLGPDVGVRRLVRFTLGTGFLGSFTTYSSLAVDAVLLADGGRWTAALGYAAATVIIGFGASALGIATGRRVRR